DAGQRAAIVQAAARGQVTLVRTTHVTRRSTSTGADVPPPGAPDPGAEGRGGPAGRMVTSPPGTSPQATAPAPPPTDAPPPEGGTG
ncbi:MAG TPA: hypothetical protein VFI47_15870, partial [Acidimicrobiales bacterium]|nr:hypothetical protein [Acidimicrobiales bacterium]